MQPDIQPYVLTNSSLSLPRRTVLLALAALGLGARPAAAAETMAYRYWDWGTRRDDYQVAVLTLALEKTAAAYGPYSVTRVLAKMSATRSRREVRVGHLMNVYVAPWRDIDAGPEDERSHQISTPILGGLLGYRWLVVRKEDLPQFQAISNAAQLKALPAGLGRGWVDVSVLRHNGYRVEDSGNMPTLLDMLINKRFAYLPFGAGPRVCIGATFALQEAVIALAVLMKRFRFDITEKTNPWPVQKLTTQPQNGLPMRVTPRTLSGQA